MKELTIKAPEGKIIDMEAYKEGRIEFIDELSIGIIYKRVFDLPKSTWYRLDGDRIESATCYGNGTIQKEMPTPGLAIAWDALSRLLKLAYFANGKRVVPVDSLEDVHVIKNIKGKAEVGRGMGCFPLAFFEESIANEFLSTHRELITEALPLL